VTLVTPLPGIATILDLAHRVWARVLLTRGTQNGFLAGGAETTGQASEKSRGSICIPMSEPSLSVRLAFGASPFADEHLHYGIAERTCGFGYVLAARPNFSYR